jgi:hypothetical protein
MIAAAFAAMLAFAFGAPAEAASRSEAAVAVNRTQATEAAYHRHYYRRHYRHRHWRR